MTDELGTMKPVPTSDPIDISWARGDLGSKELQELLAENPPRLDFPIAWDFGDTPSDGRKGPPPSDPVMLYLSLPFAETFDESVCFYCSLEDVVDDLIDGNMNAIAKKITSASSQIICAKVAARLRELANKLDDACSIEAIPDEA